MSEFWGIMDFKTMLGLSRIENCNYSIFTPVSLLIIDNSLKLFDVRAPQATNLLIPLATTGWSSTTLTEKFCLPCVLVGNIIKLCCKRHNYCYLRKWAVLRHVVSVLLHLWPILHVLHPSSPLLPCCCTQVSHRLSSGKLIN